MNAQNIKETFSILSFNCQGFKSNSAFTLSLALKNDVVFLCEHWLSTAEKSLITDQMNKSHSLYFHEAQKHERGRPYRGNAFLIRKNIFGNVNTIYKDDHIFVIKLNQHYTNIFIIGIYLISSQNNQTSVEEYQQQLNILTSLIESFSDEGEIIIVGDFQSFPQFIYDSHERNNPKRNNFSSLLTNFIQSNNLILHDVINGFGPTITYQHLNLPNSSYIDHIAIFEHSNLELTNCTVHSMSPLNFSDHVPLTTTVTYDTTISFTDEVECLTKENTIPNHIWKNEDFLQLYNTNLSHSLNDHKFNPENIDGDLQCLYELINESAKNAYKSYQLSHPKAKVSKPWWTPQLSQYKMTLSFHFNKWKSTGFDKTENNIFYNRYLMARKNFRNAVKNAQNKRIYKQYSTIETLKHTDPQKFWSKLRTLKKNNDSRLFTINKKQDKKSIVTEFANHFESLLNTPRIESNQTCRPIPPITEPFVKKITSQNIKTAISKLKPNKSPDSFHISAEHL